MAKANEQKTRGKRGDTGGTKRGSEATRRARAGRSAVKRSETDRLVTTPTGRRSRRRDVLSESHRKATKAQRRTKTRETGAVRPA